MGGRLPPTDYLSLVNTPGEINTKDFWLKYEGELPDLAAYSKIYYFEIYIFYN